MVSKSNKLDIFGNMHIHFEKIDPTVVVILKKDYCFTYIVYLTIGTKNNYGPFYFTLFKLPLTFPFSFTRQCKYNRATFAHLQTKPNQTLLTLYPDKPAILSFVVMYDLWTWGLIAL